MDQFHTFVLLMAAAILLIGIAQKMRIPYPIALVIGGTFLAFIPNINDFTFNPTLILVIVLPPILYIGAFEISFREFKQNAREIFSLALGLVVVTSLIIAVVFKWLFPQLPWSLAIAFGAIVSPPDAIAAKSILKHFSISNRLQTILEGESLINDAFALVLYRLAVMSLVTGMFSWNVAIYEFFKVTIGGLLVGFIVGFIIQRLSSYLLSSVIGAVFSFTIPYITFSIADKLGVSGVLAVVVNGLILARMVYKHHDSHRHLLAITVWDTFTILLNCFVFILIGLQLGVIVKVMSIEQMILYISYSIIITFVMLMVRMIWVNAAHLLAFFKARSHKRPTEQCNLILREGIILGWSGMRGIVSLTAVLSLPFTLHDGTPLIGRDIVIFITFFVILLTLIIPGFTLPIFLSWLKIQQTLETQTLVHNRKKLLKLAEKEVEDLLHLTLQERKFLLNYFTTHNRIMEIAASTEKELFKLDLARRKVIHSQRELLHKMEEAREIDPKILKTLELELDLEEALRIKSELS